MLHENIAYFKKKSGLKSEEIAKEVGVSVSSVEKWLSGERRPKLARLGLLANLFHTTIDDLVNGEVVFRATEEQAETNGGTVRKKG